MRLHEQTSMEEVKEIIGTIAENEEHVEEIINFCTAWTERMDAKIESGEKDLDYIIINSAYEINSDLSDTDIHNILAIAATFWYRKDVINEFYILSQKRHEMCLLGLNEEEYSALSREEIEERLKEVQSQLPLNVEDVQQGQLADNPNQNTKSYKLDTTKIKTLEDIIKVIEALNIHVFEGAAEYELLKDLI